MREYIKLLLILLISGCTSQQASNNYFDISNQNVTQYSITALGISGITYIPLESKLKISEIIKIKEYDSSFFINDKGPNSGIYKYSLNGKFLCEIGKRGNGPGEYYFSTDFDISPPKGEILVLSDHGDKIYIYSNEGRFIRTIQTPDNQTCQIYCLPERIICYNRNLGNTKNSFDFINYQGIKLSEIPNKYPYKGNSNVIVGFNPEVIFYSYQNRIYTKEIHSDTIFELAEAKFKPAYIFKQGERKLTTEVRSKKIDDPLKYFVYLNNFIKQQNLLESKNYLIFEFYLGKKLYTAICSKKNGNVSLIDANQGLVNDYDAGPSFLPNLLIEGNVLIGWINAYQLKAYIASETFKKATPKYPEKKKELEKLANSLHENDNPVLMLVKLKE